MTSHTKGKHDDLWKEPMNVFLARQNGGSENKEIYVTSFTNVLLTDHCLPVVSRPGRVEPDAAGVTTVDQPLLDNGLSLY